MTTVHSLIHSRVLWMGTTFQFRNYGQVGNSCQTIMGWNAQWASLPILFADDFLEVSLGHKVWFYLLYESSPVILLSFLCQRNSQIASTHNILEVGGKVNKFLTGFNTWVLLVYSQSLRGQAQLLCCITAFTTNNSASQHSLIGAAEHWKMHG